jgi:DNA polymerase III sliding clamp (beta) subunit (PCNA family)
MPVLINVLLEAKDGLLKVFATDLEVSLTDQVPTLERKTRQGRRFSEELV